ncbi:hypothetical protein [Proteiniclasticum sp. QWL-01]|uniref:hypothetical protein n=1 Tax=Proteiniclasticum sp. QWL-01 TaxID=3036945 RepID=UPI00240ED30F|nr:hypothetical protein [Proteiniclasticum sp. QWL-01]WFF72893.1 hypothetical protein P6M73_16795 [Proteiniclasticum sp. QWL-01]
MDDFKMTQEAISQRSGKVANNDFQHHSTSSAGFRVLDYLADGVIFEGHGRRRCSGSMIRILQCKVCQKIIDEGMSVRDAEKYIKNYDKMKDLRSRERKKDIFLADLEKQIGGYFGTKVTFRQKAKNRGKIEIEYCNQEGLERILDLLKAEE